MAQIFVSHSQLDRDQRQLFSDSFAGTNVRGVFEEFEKIERGSLTREQILADVRQANAVFIVLSGHVQNLPHTRDWVCAEGGCASGKDIWVFEPRSQLGTISVIIPGVRHYVVLENGDQDLGYLRNIIKSYDDSNVLLGMLLGAGIGVVAGRVLAKDKDLGQAAGAVLGGAGGYLLTDKSKLRPMGIQMSCPNCMSGYNVHTAQREYRCPVCNQLLLMP
jgi:hypothetical protein